MNRLSDEERCRVIGYLVEGNSIRSTVRLTGIAKNTIGKLLVEIGAACSKYQDENLRNLKLNRIQFDEIWSFDYAEQKGVTDEMPTDKPAGGIWTWTAIDAETKLIPCWMIGGRDAAAARDFIGDLVCRLAHRVQLKTDGHKAYLTAVEGAVGADVDYSMLLKVYGNSLEGPKRYSSAEYMGCKKETQIGDPDPKQISTIYMEYANLTMRMGMRRFTRLTTAFSKKVENHAAALALHFMFYNFASNHQTLKRSPAMAAGITNELWSIAAIVALIDKSN